MLITLRRQQGYLAIIAGLLIVTVGFMSLVTSFIASDKATGIQQALTSMQAYYVTQSAIDRAIYDLYRGNVSCGTGTPLTIYNAVLFSGLPGSYTVSGTTTTGYEYTTSALDSTSTADIPVAATLSTVPGTIMIDSELINYTGATATSYTGITRGAGGSTPTAHATGAMFNQSQCQLTATGSVSASQRTTLVTLRRYPFSLGPIQPVGSGSIAGTNGGVYVTAFILNGPVTFTTNGIGGNYINSIKNMLVTPSSTNLIGANIWSSGLVSMPYANSGTNISDGNGGTIGYSGYSTGIINTDVIQNNNAWPFSTALFQNFFTKNKPQTRAATGVTVCPSNISTNPPCLQTSGFVWWPATNPPLVLDVTTGNINIAANILVVESDFITKGFGPFALNSVRMDGFMYVTGNLNLNGSWIATPLLVNGALVLESASGYNSNELYVTYQPSNLGVAATFSPYARIAYSPVPSNTQEQF